MKNNLLRNSYKLLLGIVLFASFILVGSGSLHSQTRPAIPQLSLTGMDNRWDEAWYPDGRIWIPVSNQAPREFLVPVFITNRWATYNQTKAYYVADPIYSFEFKVFYDSSAVRCVGVQRFGPKDDGEKPLASDFNLSWDDYKNFHYMEYLNMNQPDQDKRKGRQVKISGTSSSPLPNTDLGGDQYKILLYLKFRVIPKVTDQALTTARNTYIYIANDTIKYNDMNVRTDAPFAKLRKYKGYEFVETDYPNPTTYTGLAGVENDTNTNKGREEPYKPGAIKLMLTDIPEIGIACERGVIGTDPSIKWWSSYEAELSDPITIDTNGIDPKTQFNFGSRMIEVKNTVGTTRLLDLEMETDQPWLEIQTVKYGGSKTPCVSSGRNCSINWLDREILGNNQIGTPIEGQMTTADPQVYLLIHCDPTKLPMNEQGEFTGLYTGYITFKSHTAGISPLRLKVPFIHFRNPYEPALYDDQGRRDGIRLTIYNYRGQKGDTCALTFGVGHRATDGVDSLFGEYENSKGVTGFGARFYPWKPKSGTSQNLINYGFGDFNPNDEQTLNASRDIRNINDTLQSITYYVKFNVDSVSHFPITVEYDLADFPENANLFIKDTANGSLFPSTDMRKATSKGGTKMAYTFYDPRITTFLIEYTLPKVINYVDALGNAIIKKGWNLVSMPVKPMNSTWNVFYKNAINTPYYFSQNQYQDEPILRVGVGYLVKYSDNVDKKFVGSYITEISEESGNKVRLYPGWNTIGSLSLPVNINKIDFTSYVDKINNVTYDPPQRSYTWTHGVWAYVTDRGYQEVSEIRPGLGYWIKVGSFDPKRNVQGWLKLIGDGKLSNEASDKYDVLANATSLTIRDNAQHETSLYLSETANTTNFELPPVPPTELFDARFTNGSLVETSNAAVISLQGVDYPVSIELNNSNVVYTFVDAITNEVLAKSEGNSAVIKASKSNMVKVLKSEVANLSVTNYPNPVNSNTTISYTVPSSELVTVKLFDALGNEVKTLVNEFKTTGEYTISFNANELTSGSYICKITSGSNSAVRTINVIK
jgi:hypothetical protein